MALYRITLNNVFNSLFLRYEFAENKQKAISQALLQNPSNILGIEAEMIDDECDKVGNETLLRAFGTTHFDKRPGIGYIVKAQAPFVKVNEEFYNFNKICDIVDWMSIEYNRVTNYMKFKQTKLVFNNPEVYFEKDKAKDARIVLLTQNEEDSVMILSRNIKDLYCNKDINTKYTWERWSATLVRTSMVERLWDELDSLSAREVMSAIKSEKAQDS